MFCQVMEQLEELTKLQFQCYQVAGFVTKKEDTTSLFQVKIKISDKEENPFLIAQISLQQGEDQTPKVTHMRGGLSETHPINLKLRPLGMRDVEMTDEDKKEGEETSAPQQKSISSMVNQQEATMLQEMGFSKIVAEKALFMVQGGGVPKAMDWIDQHRSDPDFEEELFIVVQPEGVQGGGGA